MARRRGFLHPVTKQPHSLYHVHLRWIMETVILGLAAVAAFGYGAYKLVRKGVEATGTVIEDRRREAEDDRLRAMAERRRHQEQVARDRRINFLARALQMALLQL